MVTLLPKQISFVDDTKSTVDYSHSTPVLDRDGYHCMWCTLAILHRPLGCPLDKVRAFHVDRSSYHKVLGTAKSNTFKTDGVFCSFNCIVAFLKVHGHLHKYKQSMHLLHAMYRCMTEATSATSVEITAAPDYRCLAMYGGFMSPSDYRQNISTHMEHVGDVIMSPTSALYYI